MPFLLPPFDPASHITDIVKALSNNGGYVNFHYDSGSGQYSMEWPLVVVGGNLVTAMTIFKYGYYSEDDAIAFYQPFYLVPPSVLVTNIDPAHLSVSVGANSITTDGFVNRNNYTSTLIQWQATGIRNAGAVAS